MLRNSQRIHFDGPRGKLAGILEFPNSDVRGWILFSHCFTCNKDIKAIVRISRGLSDRGWGVLRYDFSGLGGSEGVFAETNFTTNCEDLVAANEYLARNYTPARFLFGLSFGGAASLAMADRLPSVAGVIALASPSDTQHLAELLVRMDPAIDATGFGEVTIGGQTLPIKRQMIEDFRAWNLRGTVQQLKKPALVFHSPDDETVSFRHARINAGYDESSPLPRTLIPLIGSNHLLTKNERDIPMVVGIVDAWCSRWL